MTCQLQKDGMLKVISFHEQNNHGFAHSLMKHILRSKRKIAPAQKTIANDVEKFRISIKQTIDLLSMQVGGHENLGFLDYDYKNHVHCETRKVLKKGDDRVVIEYFHKMQLEDPSYFYSVQVDDDGLILNIFWADARSIVDYATLEKLCVLMQLIGQINIIDLLLHSLGSSQTNNHLWCSFTL